MNTQVDRSVLQAAALMLAFAMTAPAHHSFAGQFDPNASMETEGELIEVRWANPHAHLKVCTVDKGKVVVQIEEYDPLRTIHMNQSMNVPARTVEAVFFLAAQVVRDTGSLRL